MAIPLVGREPNPTSPPVREFKRYPGFRVVFDNLLQLRAAMVQDDKVIIDSLAKRNARAIAAQREFVALLGMKRSFNIEHFLPGVLEAAKRRHPKEEGLTEVLRAVYPAIALVSFAPQLYDYPIIDAIAARLNKSKQATVFKKDPEEGLAPDTQRANIDRAVTMAEERMPFDADLVAHVQSVYEALVPATVAVQQTMFDRTYRLDDWDGLAFMGFDQK